MEKQANHKITWHPWSNSVFTEAESEGKLIFLYLQASWCQWCRRMESESLTDPQISLLIDRYFISLRIDTDSRPDLNLRYNMGGWPSIAILTSEGDVITGGTFLNKEELKKLLAHCIFLYQSQKKELQDRLRQAKKKVSHHIGEGAENAAISPAILQKTLEFLETDFDPLYGGFGRAPKFPHYEAIELSLLATHLYHDPRMKEILIRTLNGMVEGELFDQEEGGFFRYARNRDWSAPQYEKMLVDNLWLLQNYLDAYLVTGMERYKNIAQSILQYLDTSLYDPGQSVFFGSQRADEQYYQLTGEERKFFPAPPHGKTIYTDWNALAVSVLLKASVILNKEIYRDRVRKIIIHLWQHCSVEGWREGSGAGSDASAGEDLYEGSGKGPDEDSYKRSSEDLSKDMADKRQGEGMESKGMSMLHTADLSEKTSWRLLSDQLYMARALLDCYQAFGDELYLSLAELLAQFLHRRFYDKKGGFWDRMDTDVPYGRLKERVKPILDNALAAEFFLKIGIITQNSKYLSIARHTLTFFSKDFPRYGIFASRYALTCHLALHPPVLIIILGRRGDPQTQTFLEKLFALYEPRKIIRMLDLDQHPEMIQLLQQHGHRAPRGYLYIGQDCRFETDNSEDLIQAINNLAPTRIQKEG
jgi:uncharacterized protein YyaL (SSP411 family)